jgi:hypothetical protein
MASVLALVVILASLAGPALALDKYAAEFLKIPVGARAIGMGGAFSAVADDATAAYWNPAGLIFGSKRQIWAEHAEQFGDAVNHNYLAFRQPLNATGGGNLQTIGIGFTHVGVSDIEVRDLDPTKLVAGEPGEGGQYDDENGNGAWDVGERLYLENIPFSFDSTNQFALTFSYARTLGDLFAVGGTVKIVRQSLIDNSSFGVGADIGALYMPTQNFTASLRIWDVTTTYLAWDSGENEVVRPTVTLAAAYSRYVDALRGSFTFAGDWDTTFDNRKSASAVSYGETVLGSDFHGGVEYWYQQVLALRVGATTDALTVGGGFRFRGLGIDYAFVGDHPDLDSTHRIGGSFSF